MSSMTSYRDLEVWQKSIDFVAAIYKATENFPKNEQYGLTNQIRRASISIPSNIAEGYYRGHLPEYIRFLKIGFSSGGEVETQLIIAKKLGFLSEKDYGELEISLSNIMKMLNKLIQALTHR